MKETFTKQEFNLFLDLYLDTIDENNITTIIPTKLYDRHYPLENYKRAIKRIVKENYNSDLITLKIN